MNYKNRITRTADADPKTLRDHGYNWRLHPKEQRDALEAVLERVGWVQRVVVNENTMRIVDGHLRVSVARSRGEATIPVSYVNLTEEEERLALATFDTVGTFDVADPKVLKDLLAEVGDVNGSLAKLIQTVSVESGLITSDVPSSAPGEGPKEKAPRMKTLLPVFAIVDQDDSRCCVMKQAGLLYGTTTRLRKCRCHPTQLYAPVGALDYEGIAANKHVRVVVRAKDWSSAFESGEKVRLAGAEPIFWLKDLKETPTSAVVVCDIDAENPEGFVGRRTLLWGKDLMMLIRARNLLGEDCYGVASPTPADASEDGSLILWEERVTAHLVIPPMPLKIKNPKVKDLGFNVPHPMPIAANINAATFALCFAEAGKGIEEPDLTPIEVVR